MASTTLAFRPAGTRCARPLVLLDELEQEQPAAVPVGLGGPSPPVTTLNAVTIQRRPPIWPTGPVEDTGDVEDHRRVGG